MLKTSTVDEHDKTSVFPLPGPHGWCGACLRSAPPGGYGYCADGLPPPEDDDLVTVARPSRHWGFCSDLCARQEMAAHRLKVRHETALLIVQ